MSLSSDMSAILLAEAPHLLPRCALRDRLLIANSEGLGSEARSWRRVTDSEFRSLSAGPEAPRDSAVCTLFSVPPGLCRRLAASWTPRDASNRSRPTEEGLISDLVDFFAFVDAPVHGTCSVRLDRVDERGMDAGPGPIGLNAGIAARINLGEDEAALLVGPLDLAPLRGGLVRLTLQPGEGVFVRKGVVARLIAGSRVAPLIASVLPEA